MTATAQAKTNGFDFKPETPPESPPPTNIHFPNISYQVDDVQISRASQVVKTGNGHKDAEEQQLVDLHKQKFEANYQDEAKSIEGRHSELGLAIPYLNAQIQKLEADLAITNDGDYADVEVAGLPWTPVERFHVGWAGVAFGLLMVVGIMMNIDFFNTVMKGQSWFLIFAVSLLPIFGAAITKSFLEENRDETLQRKFFNFLCATAIVGFFMMYLAMGFQSSSDSAVAASGYDGVAQVSVLDILTKICRMTGQALLEAAGGAVLYMVFIKNWRAHGEKRIINEFVPNKRHVDLSAQLVRVNEKLANVHGEKVAIEHWITAQQQQMASIIAEVVSQYHHQLTR